MMSSKSSTEISYELLSYLKLRKLLPKLLRNEERLKKRKLRGKATREDLIELESVRSKIKGTLRKYHSNYFYTKYFKKAS
jgi:hypothetical protein